MRDLKELTSMVEKLCKKGQAYRRKRMAAGEKSSAYLSGRAVKVCKGQMQGEHADPDGDDITIDPDTNFKLDLKHLLKKHIVDDGEEIEEIDALSEDEEYCPKCMEGLRKTIRETFDELEEKKGKCKPSKGKRFAKRVNGKCRSFGQKGKAKGGGDRIRPGTKKGHAYCARSAKIKGGQARCSKNQAQRRRWRC